MADEPRSPEGATDGRLDRECAVFTRYLTGGPPTEALCAAYRRGHAHMPLDDAGGPAATTLDRWALRVARVGTPWARASDAYHRFFHPTGVLRKKLVLLLAILEHAPPHHTELNRGSGGGPVGAVLGLAATGIAFGLAVVGGGLLLGPVHLWSRARTPKTSAGRDARG